MEFQRMSNEDMLQYCKEALAWPDFGPIDTMFFETVKRILLGEISARETFDYQDGIFDDEGYFKESETSENYYNPEPDGSIQL